MTAIKTHRISNTYGLVVCGGNSSRMGKDKDLLQYYDKPQRYHVYDMLLPFCEKVFISCNAGQTDSIEAGYGFITDDTAFNNIGPMAALLSAFTKFPEKNMLLIGCDYPFLTANELRLFSRRCKDAPVSFINGTENIYEPLLAWYPAISFTTLKDMSRAGHSSLQEYLKDNNAEKYYPDEINSIISIDTYADFIKATGILSS